MRPILSILGLIAIGPAFGTPARAAEIFQIPNTAGQILIDGKLDDAAWEEALELELAYETEPGENVEPPVRTSCRMIYSHTHLYYSCTAYDPEPHRIRARYTGRDQALDDDTIGLAIDTFNDHNTAFVLDVNPLGVQNDRLYIEATGASDSTWDAVWDSAGRLTDFGFEVEAAIPFSSLRFPRTTGRQTWGFNFRRYQTRDAYRRIALVPLDRNDRCRTCQHALLVGFENIDPGHNLEITPTITSLRTATREDFPDGPLAAADPDVEPGLTVNWGVTPNFTLASALNPDFSQVEADVAQLDINTSFALFFPERRPFFLEGSDYFSTQLRAVYTRSVADPDWGLKLTGKEGRHAVGISVARDAITTLLLPGPESSALDSLDRESTAAVLRYRRDLTESSTFGVLVTDRRSGDYGSRTAGADLRLRLTPNDYLDVQWLHSRTEYPDAVRETHGLPAGVLEGSALTASYRHSRRSWNLNGSVTDIGDDFRADLGFMPQVGYRRAVAGGGYEWFGDDDRWYTSIEIGGDWDRTESHDGALLEEEWEFYAGFVGHKQLACYFGGGTRDRVFRGVAFDQRFGWSSASIQPRGDLEIGLDLALGDAIDVAGVRAGDEVAIEPYVDWRPGRHLRANLSHTHRRFDIDAGRLFTADLTELRLVYQFDRRTFLRLITQRTDLTRDPALYEGEVDASREEIFGQLLLSYTVTPQTVLFLGYSSERLDVERSGLTETGNTVFLKMGYNWQP